MTNLSGANLNNRNAVGPQGEGRDSPSSFSRYPKYKDSGVEWLGEVPEHWVILSLKHLLQQIISGLTSTQVDQSDGTAPVTRIETISRGVIDRERLGYISVDDAREDKMLLAGDICFSNINSLNMIGNCAQYRGGEILYAGMNLLVLRPLSGINSQWLFWVISSGLFRNVVESLAKPAINQASIPQGSLASIFVTKLPVEEQQAIATFLDHETAKIDTLITEQERLIALLAEKRQAVISHAVTKGLDPNVPMKDSGVEWLGEVPEHWEIKALKRALAEPLMYGANESSDDDTPGNPRFVRITDIDEHGGLREETFRSLPYDIAKPYLLHNGDILLARSGATVGKSFIYREAWGVCCFAGYLIRARLSPEQMNAEYLYFCCQSNFYWQYIGSEQIQATIQNVSAEKYANFIIPFPSVSEQKTIVDFLQQEMFKLDELTTEARRTIDLLKERRSALISAAVTGKIDVRGLVDKEAAA